MITIHAKIIRLLDSHNITYQTFHHEPVITSQDAATIRGTDMSKGAKSLLFFADNKPVLFVLGGDKKVDFKKAKTFLNVKDLRMATHEEVLSLTGTEIGGVSPIGVAINVPTYLDKAFTHNDVMDFNAGDRTKSIEMAVTDYLAVVKPTVFAFSV